MRRVMLLSSQIDIATAEVSSDRLSRQRTVAHRSEPERSRRRGRSAPQNAAAAGLIDDDLGIGIIALPCSGPANSFSLIGFFRFTVKKVTRSKRASRRARWPARCRASRRDRERPRPAARSVRRGSAPAPRQAGWRACGSNREAPERCAPRRIVEGEAVIDTGYRADDAPRRSSSATR